MACFPRVNWNSIRKIWRLLSGKFTQFIKLLLEELKLERLLRLAELKPFSVNPSALIHQRLAIPSHDMSWAIRKPENLNSIEYFRGDALESYVNWLSWLNSFCLWILTDVSTKLMINAMTVKSSSMTSLANNPQGQTKMLKCHPHSSSPNKSTPITRLPLIAALSDRK